MSEAYAAYGSLIPLAQREGIVRFVVGAVVAHQEKVLLLRRRQEDFKGGIYELPSGVVEKGETLAQALAREIEEETGLELLRIKGYIGSFDYLSKSGRATRQLNFVFEVAAQSQVRLTEHDNHVWVNQATLAELTVTGETRLAVTSAQFLVKEIQIRE